MNLQRWVRCLTLLAGDRSEEDGERDERAGGPYGPEGRETRRFDGRA